MFEALTDRLFDAIAAASTLAGGSLTFAMLWAQSAVYLGPCPARPPLDFGAHAERRAAVDAGFSSLLALTTAVIVSSVWMHPRPFTVLPIRNYLNHTPDSSFPSDHGTLLFALGFALLISTSRPGRQFGSLAVVLGVSVGWARIFLGAHYPLDIVGAAVVAAIAVLVVASPGGPHNWRTPDRLGGSIFLAGRSLRIYGNAFKNRRPVFDLKLFGMSNER
ncbi:MULTISPECIES: phosphatase PAP2 family protein [Bradyrhizobium]|jgi:undecaprenyl-diphosphatase|nr:MULTISPECIES: phosphatase PAP2 family protein [Bradyrhizobium]OYU86457.1 MAG: undecaprenyl-diphosphatase [Bradyrhizobiaceae bacterium PARB1]